ncbi:MAG: hypothetical protein HY660_04775 [Armatimonadetes bacterium]|nr:hypothetical protein [Armatimonadota bacterium]
MMACTRTSGNAAPAGAARRMAARVRRAMILLAAALLLAGGPAVATPPAAPAAQGAPGAAGGPGDPRRLDSGAAQVGPGDIQQVSVRVALDGGALHSVLTERIISTIRAIAERLLLGRRPDAVARAEAQVGQVLTSVVGRVLSGFSVMETSIQPGREAVVRVRLRPVGRAVQEVEVAPNLGAVHPRLRPLLAGQLSTRAAPSLAALVRGVPTEALEWATPIIEASGRETVEAALPGFTASFGLQDVPLTKLTVVVTPKDSRIIRDIGVRFRSSSIPLLLLEQHGPQVASMAEPLRGLPVAYAQANRAQLEDLLAREMAANELTREYRLIARPALSVAETTYVTVVADSLLYRGRIEAQLNIGAQAPPPQIIAHVGKMATPTLELFAETYLTPTTLGLTWDVGARYDLSERTALGLSQHLSAQGVSLWTLYRPSNEVSLRAEYNWAQQLLEGRLGYRLNSFLSWEVVGTSRGEWWLRLVSNL